MTDEMSGLASLARKKAAIMGELKKFTKDKQNPKQGYSYPSAESIFDTIRGMMAQHGLVLFTSAVSGNQEHFASQKGTPGLHTTVQYRMLWVDTETGATVEDYWLSEGDDYQDKGYSKCATLALKYYLLTTFVVSSGDASDDPDSGIRDRSSQKPRQQGAATPPVNANGNQRTSTSKTQNGAPVAFADGETRQIELTAVTVEEGKSQRRYRFTNVGGLQNVMAYSRDIFREGNWCAENDWEKLGIYDFPALCPATVKYHAFQDGGGGYWTVESVEAFRLEQLAMNHDATSATEDAYKIDDPLKGEMLDITRVEPRMHKGRTQRYQWVGHAMFERQPITVLIFKEDELAIREAGYDTSGWDTPDGRTYRDGGIAMTTARTKTGRQVAAVWHIGHQRLVETERAT